MLVILKFQMHISIQYIKNEKQSRHIQATLNL